MLRITIRADSQRVIIDGAIRSVREAHAALNAIYQIERELLSRLRAGDCSQQRVAHPRQAGQDRDKPANIQRRVKLYAVKTVAKKNS